jgi:hypothetical protein
MGWARSRLVQQINKIFWVVKHTKSVGNPQGVTTKLTRTLDKQAVKIWTALCWVHYNEHYSKKKAGNFLRGRTTNSIPHGWLFIQLQTTNGYGQTSLVSGEDSVSTYDAVKLRNPNLQIVSNIERTHRMYSTTLHQLKIKTVEAGCGAHPASCTMDTVVFFPGNEAAVEWS